VIAVSGDLSFGEVALGESADRTMRISNSGNDALAVSSLTGPTGGAFAASWTSGTVAPGSGQDVTIRFSPAEPPPSSRRVTGQARFGH
jgi:hypothetical protein